MYCAVRMYLTEIHIGFRTLFRKLWLSMTLAFLDSHKFITFSCCLRFSCKSSWHKLISVMECHILFNFLQTFHNIWKFKKADITFLLKKYFIFLSKKKWQKLKSIFFHRRNMPASPPGLRPTILVEEPTSPCNEDQDHRRNSASSSKDHRRPSRGRSRSSERRPSSSSDLKHSSHTSSHTNHSIG